MATNTAKYEANLRDITATFDNSVMAATPFYPSICTMRTSRRADEKYGWIGNMPGMREWLGDRQFGQIRAADFVLENKLWESSLEINRQDMDDDEMGFYNDAAGQLGTEAGYHPDELLVETIEAAESTVCWDGQYFYDTDHSWGDSGTQSNDVTSTVSSTTSITVEEFKSALRAAVLKMLGFKRDNGKLYNRPTAGRLSGLTIGVPLALRDVANDIASSRFIVRSSAAVDNVVIDDFNVVTLPSLASSVKMHLWKTDMALKPFVFQARQPLRRFTKGMDDIEFKEVKFMTEARYNVGYLAWWNAVLTTFTT